MSVLKIERTFTLDPTSVFSYLTKTENLLKWWGPEGMNMKEHSLDLSKPGAWSSTLVNAEGGLHKMSGHVVTIDPPNSVEFTWGWHNDEDVRGIETVVRFEVSENRAGGTDFLLIHSGLTNEESAENHGKGWSSSLRKLERSINEN
ncbi:MAG: SRPBCC domain-containing protein [Sneathiella sp.]